MKTLLALVLMIGSLNVFAAELGEGSADCISGVQTGRFQDSDVVIASNETDSSQETSSGSGASR